MLSPARLVSAVAALAVAGALAAASGPAQTTGGQAGDRLFRSSFDGCSYGAWRLSGSGSSFQTVRTPTLAGNCASAVVLGADAANRINPGSDGALMWLPDDWGATGATIWQRFFVYFPADFRATQGEWNWFGEWHNDAGYKQFVQSGAITWEYANISWTVRNLKKARIALRVLGGPSATPRRIWSNAPSQLKLGHWYDVLARIVWSPDPAVGRVDWWLDGKRILSISTPTLYTRPDGAVSTSWPELGYYRLHTDYPARILFDEVMLGRTAASVCTGLPRAIPACPANALRASRQSG